MQSPCPAPLIEFPQLTCLNIEDTGIPCPHPQEFRKLIAREKRIKDIETIKLFEIQSFNCGLTGVSEQEEYQLLQGKSSLELLGLIRSYMTSSNRSCADIDKIICLLELLAEGKGLWLDTLVLEKSRRNLPCDALFEDLRKLDPREVVFKLLFALKYHLPHGTNRDTLFFINHIPSMQANCLSRLEVSKGSISPYFLQSLDQFGNLNHLALTNIRPNWCILSALPKLPQLRILDLSGNNIKTLKGLHTAAKQTKFPELNVFNLANNQIFTETRYLIELINLTYLDLSDNDLTAMPLIGNLKWLVRLDVSHNHIPLTQLPKSINIKEYIGTPQKD